MSIVLSVVILVGVLCLLNLLLIVGVIRRLRDHSTLLSGMGSAPPAIEVGTEIDAFQVQTVRGEPLSRAELAEETVVAFFSPTCGPCKEELPKFTPFARNYPGGRDRVLAVVVGEPQEADDFVAQLGPVAKVVVEERGGALGNAFKTSAFPTLMTVAPREDGTLVVTSNHVELDQAAPAVA